MLPLLILALDMAGPASPLTVREVAALAAGEAPAVARARAETDLARARHTAARSRLGPTLTADLGLLWTDDPVDAFGLALKQERFSAPEFFASDPNHPGFTRDWNGTLSAAWRIDLFGPAHEARAAGRFAEAADRVASRTRDAAVFQAITAFAAAARSEEALALLAEREKDAQEDLELAASLHEQGLTTSADPARASAALAEIRAEAAGHRAELAAARAALAALIGSEAARRPLAGLPASGPIPGAASAERDDVAAAELAAKAARARERAASAARWPSLLVSGRYELHAPQPGRRWGDSMSVFGGLRIPLFTSGEVGSRIAEARAAFRAADATAHEARRSAEKDLVSARAALEAAESRLKAFIEAEAAAKRAREIQQARYEEGAARLADLLDSRAAELRARLGASTARSERAVAEASLQLALGLPPEGEEIP
jgi:outer membrane protein TolC